MDLLNKTIQELRELNAQCGKSLDPLVPDQPFTRDEAKALRKRVQAEIRSRGETIYADVGKSTAFSRSRMQTAKVNPVRKEQVQ